MTSPEELLTQFIQAGAFLGAAFAYGTQSKIVAGTVGRISCQPDAPAVSGSTWWDLASLTKVMSTTPCAMRAIRAGYFDLGTRVKDVIPESQLGAATVEHLLRHTSGLPPYLDVTHHQDAGDARSALMATVPEAPPGEKSSYSCLGFVLLAEIIERTTGESLAVFADQQIFGPLGIEAVYLPDRNLAELCAPTELTPSWRVAMARKRGEVWAHDPVIQGRVHDPIAYVLGGISGNAGLFAPLAGVVSYMQALVRNHEVFGGDLPLWIRPGENGTRPLGFDCKSPVGSSAGKNFGPRSYGHTGYTGTAFWVDPDAKVFATLLTNRIHPRDESDLILQARPQYFDLAFASASALL